MNDEDLVWLEPLSPKEIIEDELIKKQKKDKFYVLYSGGKDSGCVDDFIATNYPENYGGRVFTNTTIASPITRKFALEYSAELGRKIEMTWPTIKTFYDIVIEKGFPGAGSHGIIMGYLKFHSWYYYMKDKIKKGEKACFISGVRKKESWARDKKRFYTKKPVDENAGMIFCKPFLYKNGSQLMEYFIKNGIKKSPAYDYFDKSGECWCGCFYNEWELKMIETHDPFLFNTIKWMESKVEKKIKTLRYRQIPILKTHPRKNKDVIIKLKEQLNNLEKFPHWGRSVGADISEMQSTLGEFVTNEDYCGESCQIS